MCRSECRCSPIRVCCSWMSRCVRSFVVRENVVRSDPAGTHTRARALQTSGLDSFTANKLMHTLRSIAHRQRTVICTIHQPRSDIFRLCDSIILLAKGTYLFVRTSARLLCLTRLLTSRCDRCPLRQAGVRRIDPAGDGVLCECRLPVPDARQSGRLLPRPDLGRQSDATSGTRVTRPHQLVGRAVCSIECERGDGLVARSCRHTS